MIITSNIRVRLDAYNMGKLRTVLFAKAEDGRSAVNESEQIGLVLKVVDEGLMVMRRYLDSSALLEISNLDCLKIKQAINEFWGMSEVFVEDNELVISGILSNGYSHSNSLENRYCQFDITKCDMSLLVQSNGLVCGSDGGTFETLRLVMFISKQQVNEMIDLQEFIDRKSNDKESFALYRYLLAEVRLENDCLIIGRFDLEQEVRFNLPPYAIKHLQAKFENERVELVEVEVDKVDDRLEIRVISNRDYWCQVAISVYDNSEFSWDCNVSIEDDFDFEIKL